MHREVNVMVGACPVIHDRCPADCLKIQHTFHTFAAARWNWAVALK